jgi:hypothetical protein
VINALATAALLVALVPSGHDFTVPEAQRAFRSQTGLPLVKFAAASTPEVTSLRTRPHNTARFGEFQLFVLRPTRVQHLRRVFAHGTRADGRGVHWVPDQAGGWIAVTLFRRNLILRGSHPRPRATPTSGGRASSAPWRRLRSLFVDRGTTCRKRSRTRANPRSRRAREQTGRHQ